MKYPIAMGYMKVYAGPGGVSKSDIGIDISADVQVLPDGTLKMPPQFQSPDNRAQPFSSMDAPLMIKLKAGTSGTLELHLKVDYQYFMQNKMPFPSIGPFSPPDWVIPETLPDIIKGSVRCDARWKYSSTPVGTLTLEYDGAELSPRTDDCYVSVDRTHQTGGLTTGQIQLIPRFEYSGKFTTASVTPVRPTVFLSLIDIQQPKPPAPPGPSKNLEHTVYFLFNEKNHASPQNNNPANFFDRKDPLKSLREFMESIKNGIGLKNIQQVDVNGYASPPGTTLYNDNLSYDRANYIAQWLRNNYHADIPPQAIWPHGEPSDRTDEKDDPKLRVVKVVITLKAGVQAP